MHLGEKVEQVYDCYLNMDNTAHELEKTASWDERYSTIGEIWDNIASHTCI